jgi:hypothetical protein
MCCFPVFLKNLITSQWYAHSFQMYHSEHENPLILWSSIINKRTWVSCQVLCSENGHCNVSRLQPIIQSHDSTMKTQAVWFHCSFLDKPITAVIWIVGYFQRWIEKFVWRSWPIWSCYLEIRLKELMMEGYLVLSRTGSSYCPNAN